MAQSDDAIRLYLMFLEDPTSLRDEAEIKKREAAVEGTKDPVDKLLAIAHLERAQNVDGSEFRDAFIRDAKPWADENGVTVSAFVKMGVPIEDLRSARFDVGRRKSGTARGAAAASSPTGRTRVSVETVQESALGMTEAFTLAALRDRTGASLGTIRKVVGELVESGQLGDLGPDPDHDGRGRAPTLYRKT